MASLPSLVGADDLLRRLSLVSAATAMVALEPGDAVGPDEPPIDLPMRVRPVLSILLETGAPRVIVRDEESRSATSTSRRSRR